MSTGSTVQTPDRKATSRPTSARALVTIDANEAAAHVAYMLDEVIAIYPITPSSTMGELADQWASEGRPNLWGTVPRVVEMQSEAGAAGAVHGALQAGALTTTFTASQGLLLMIPNLYKIAGELTAAVIHVAARSLAAQGLSIFGDHADVMVCRATGCALLCSGSVQETLDHALITHAATLESRVPFLHFFDGFRTSHELNKVEMLTDDDLRALIDDDLIRAHRARALSPDHPVLRGTAQNPDVYFQGRESVNPYYAACPRIVQNMMDRFASLTGRQYHLFDYVGDPHAERVIVLMGSGAEVAQETVEALTEQGEPVGVLKVRLFRPFLPDKFVEALPRSVKAIAVLDRTKEPGAIGEPLYLDVVASLAEQGQILDNRPNVIGGRYGLGSKEFTPAMVKAVFDELRKDSPRNHFTIGINDDVSHTSLPYDPDFTTEDPRTTRAMFYGLGSDGTVGANKNSIKIIGEGTDLVAQGYFVYDSKKSGSITISHLRFGPKAIRSSYLITRANFVACHQFEFLSRIDVLGAAEPGATVLLNCPFGPEEVWHALPRPVQKQLIEKNLKLYVIDAQKLAGEIEMGRRINTIMQTCFFAISGVLPRDEAIAAIKHSIEKSYGKRGEAVVRKNFLAVDRTLEVLHEVPVPSEATSNIEWLDPIHGDAPGFVHDVTGPMIAWRGNDLPVSKLPIDGTYPMGTSKYEKRNIATEVPVWDNEICIQCGKCALVCPHGVIRAKVYQPEALANAPEGFKSSSAKWKELPDQKFTLQISTDDCTGCGLCVEICPVKNKSQVKLKAINMTPRAPEGPDRDREHAQWDFFLNLPDTDRSHLEHSHVKDAQLLLPLFEFSGACAGCGETPYIKLMTQMFGDRMMIANATGCSSIYGGNLPTTPYTTNAEGRGPSWSNSLFEDNAEFGLGMRLAVDTQGRHARGLLAKLGGLLGDDLVRGLLEADQSTEAGIVEQRARVAALKAKLRGLDGDGVRDLDAVADALVKRSVWIVGGDGWAYDIGFGGVDHVVASGEDVNLLVLDTEVYSNTGGQMSKSTPRGAVAKFAAGGKQMPKKDLAMIAMTYGTAYIARVAMGANDMHTLKVFKEAESFPGPSLILAYSHCIAHGYDLRHGLDQQKAAVQTGYWPLFRYDPRRLAKGENPIQLDSKPPAMPLKKYTYNETRYTMLAQAHPEEAERLAVLAQEDVLSRWRMYEHMAAMSVKPPSESAPAQTQAQAPAAAAPNVGGNQS